MTIGEALAQARHQAGLSVAEVSERTRIRSAIIRGIEQDDYGECGGDFYARGHIRAIADAVGADPRPLIQEYDAAHPAAGMQSTAADLYKPASPFVKRERRRAARAAALAVVLLAVIGAACYELVSGVGQTQRLAATAKTGPGTASGPHHAAPRAHAAAAPRSRASSPSAPSAPATAHPATPAHSAAPVQVLVPAAATSFGPGGTADGDDPQQAVYAIDSDPATFWHTSWYTTPQFGNLKTGTGLLVDLGRTETITSVDVTLGSTPGADLQLRAGDTPSLAALPQVASASGAGGTTHLRLASGVRARYVLLWFTTLPPDAAGTYQVNVYNVSVTGRL
ncbi:MAG: helix-turn-helix domain-containing protein [Streptosporangiaceae bacterium]|nr:helix-turn-helix domain-containing protein [Streptosporangiaceae bacterium]MBV9856773.1 helix-turn-helix domain-containing protein [Streptosporangiaceae bacterium]